MTTNMYTSVLSLLSDNFITSNSKVLSVIFTGHRLTVTIAAG